MQRLLSGQRLKEICIQFLELFFCIVSASLGLCPIHYRHFGILGLQTLSLQLSKTFGSFWVPSPYAAVQKLSPGRKVGRLQGSPHQVAFSWGLQSSTAYLMFENRCLINFFQFPNCFWWRATPIAVIPS